MKPGDLPGLLWMKFIAVATGDMISDLVCMMYLEHSLILGTIFLLTYMMEILAFIKIISSASYYSFSPALI